MLFRRRRAPYLTPIPASLRLGLLTLCASSPYESHALAAQLMRYSRWGHGDVIVAGAPTAPCAGAWATGSALPLGIAALDAGEQRLFGRHIRERVTRHGSIVGPARDVEALWPWVACSRVRSRDERWNQPLLMVPTDQAWQEIAAPWRDHEVYGRVYAAHGADYPHVFPASCAMFEEELGYDPRRDGGGYSTHVRSLCSAGRTFIATDEVGVMFKTDVGSLYGGTAGLTGVWVRPDQRGRGVATAALVATCDLIYRDLAQTITLYVNDYNTPARSLYAKLGAVQVGTMATILL